MLNVTKLMPGYPQSGTVTITNTGDDAGGLVRHGANLVRHAGPGGGSPRPRSSTSRSRATADVTSSTASSTSLGTVDLGAWAVGQTATSLHRRAARHRPGRRRQRVPGLGGVASTSTGSSPPSARTAAPAAMAPVARTRPPRDPVAAGGLGRALLGLVCLVLIATLLPPLLGYQRYVRGRRLDGADDPPRVGDLRRGRPSRPGSRSATSSPTSRPATRHALDAPDRLAASSIPTGRGSSAPRATPTPRRTAAVHARPAVQARVKRSPSPTWATSSCCSPPAARMLCSSLPAVRSRCHARAAVARRRPPAGAARMRRRSRPGALAARPLLAMPATDANFNRLREHRDASTTETRRVLPRLLVRRAPTRRGSPAFAVKRGSRPAVHAGPRAPRARGRARRLQERPRTTIRACSRVQARHHAAGRRHRSPCTARCCPTPPRAAAAHRLSFTPARRRPTAATVTLTPGEQALARTFGIDEAQRLPGQQLLYHPVGSPSATRATRATSSPTRSP